MPLPSLESESDLLMSLSPNLATYTSSPKDVTVDIQISSNPPTTVNYFCEFQEGGDLKSASELDMSITLDIEHRDFAESKEAVLQESCEEKVEPTNFQIDDDILSVEYESFLCGFDVDESVDEGFCAEYESFSFDPIQTGLLFENCKSKFVQFESIGTKNFALN